jgi:hypothetical protein
MDSIAVVGNANSQNRGPRRREVGNASFFDADLSVEISNRLASD